MEINLKPGVYVVAVSGGVDSVVLLNLLMGKYSLKAQSQKPKATPSDKTTLDFETFDSKHRFVVAHYDHGIREDSIKDRKFVEKLANKYHLPFVYNEGHLGAGASEAKAREARYKFLHKVRRACGSRAIITAHHQDDLIETAIINLLRGTGRKGLSSLQNRKPILRPLLEYSKTEIKAYALKYKLRWCEDPTNKDTKYLRNYVRNNIVTKLTVAQRKKLVELLSHVQKTNAELDLQIAKLTLITGSGNGMDRQLFISFPHKVALEIMAEWLRNSGIRNFDKKMLEKLVIGAKTLTPGKQLDVDSSVLIRLSRQKLYLVNK